MGKIIVSTALSVDGFANGRDGDISVMPLDEGFNQHNASLIRNAATLLYGGITYRQMVEHWPNVSQDSDASAAEKEIARICAAGIPIVAVSDSLTEEETGPWQEQTRIVSRADAHQVVAELRNADGDTCIFGSRTVWSDLLDAGLVDELYLLVGPKLVAGDAPAFGDVSERELRLLGAEQLPGSQIVARRYAVAD